MPRPSVLWVNGRFLAEDEPALSPLDRGFTLGDGVFETMWADHRYIFRQAQHLFRLQGGASILKLSPLPEGVLAGALQEVLASLPDSPHLVRLTVSRGVDRQRGISVHSQPAPTMVVQASPAEQLSEETYAKGWGVGVSSIRRNETSPLSRIKSLNYGDAILAREEARHAGYDEALLLNVHGDVASAAAANVFIVRERALWTAPARSGVLPGVTRACVLALAAELGVPAWEKAFGVEELQAAEEVFLTNTAVGVMPIVAVNDTVVGSGAPGRLTRQLARGYWGLVERELQHET